MVVDGADGASAALSPRASARRDQPHECHCKPRGPLRTDLLLSIVVPSYNEGATIARAVRELLAIDYPCRVELIVVDDGSTDDTLAQLKQFDDERLVVFKHPANLGKGAALMSGIGLARGTHFMPFDADLEYDPNDVSRVVAPVVSGRAEVVYGVRLFGANTVYQTYRYAWGNKVTTLAANLLFDAYISDLHTCLKLIPMELVRDLSLRESGFGLDTEITASVLKRGYRPFEVPVSYHSRTHAQGKKITWRDGVTCMQILARVRWTTSYSRRAPATSRELKVNNVVIDLNRAESHPAERRTNQSVGHGLRSGVEPPLEVNANSPAASRRGHPRGSSL
jgi:dolichol-phosphate hexosyltransferase